MIPDRKEQYRDRGIRGSTPIIIQVISIKFIAVYNSYVECTNQLKPDREPTGITISYYVYFYQIYHWTNMSWKLSASLFNKDSINMQPTCITHSSLMHALARCCTHVRSITNLTLVLIVFRTCYYFFPNNTLYRGIFLNLNTINMRIVHWCMHACSFNNKSSFR